jgi:hypothetical protein
MIAAFAALYGPSAVDMRLIQSIDATSTDPSRDSLLLICLLRLESIAAAFRFDRRTNPANPI